MKKTRSQTQTAAGFETGHVAEAEDRAKLHADTTPKDFTLSPMSLFCLGSGNALVYCFSRKRSR
jgi:hypothetical protein